MFLLSIKAQMILCDKEGFIKYRDIHKELYNFLMGF